MARGAEIEELAFSESLKNSI